MMSNETSVKDVNETTMSADEETRHCVRCGLCLSVCPGYRESLNETDSPRARVALVQAITEGVLDAPNERYAGAFFRCLLCGACTFVCPSGVAVDRILELTRGDLAEQGLLPEALAELDARIAQYRNISAEENEGRLIWVDNLPAPPTGLGKEQAEVAYFVGCVSSFFPRSYQVPQALVQIFDRTGVDYALLGGSEWCCGYPMFINGEMDKARDLIRHNVEAVQAMGVKKIVFSCASCYHFWSHSYPTALGVNDLEDDLGIEVMHATEFLADLLEAGALPLQGDEDVREQVVTYHDPCDLGRKGGVIEAPRRVLAQLPGVRLVEMAENRDSSHCCGGGGNLESFAPEVGQAVAGSRIRQAAETGAKTLISACQQCERTLANAARAERIRVRVKDVAELVLDALDEAQSSEGD